jgi:UDP-N-acetylmuramate dehydrogenase
MDDQKNIQLFQRLKQTFRGHILVDEMLSEHTWFRIGGPADFFLYPKDLEDLAAVIDFARREGITVFVIGNGSNLLCSDEGYRGFIIDLSRTFTHVQCKGHVVTVGAGFALKDLLQYCLERGLSGLESLVGIPAQVGGAIFQNAGAYGGEVCDRLNNVRLLDPYGSLERRSKEDLQPQYRKIRLAPGTILVEAQFFLAEGHPKKMEAAQQSYLRQRRDKQPLSLPSAGSVFKRPEADYAGRLIEEAGCKGLRIGDAMVSKKHANFIVNCHLASATDVIRLIDEVRQRVMERFGVELEMEIEKVGF